MFEAVVNQNEIYLIYFEIQSYFRKKKEGWVFLSHNSTVVLEMFCLILLKYFQ